MDDREGCSFAIRRPLPVTGTLGVLEKADVVGILSNLASTLARLEAIAERGIVKNVGKLTQTAGFPLSSLCAKVPAWLRELTPLRA